MAKAWTTALVGILGLMLLITCSQSPLGRRQLTLMPADQLEAMGEKAFQKIDEETPTTQNETVKQYVECITNAITQVVSSKEEAPNNWDVKVFDAEAVNAFALPGGNIGVYTGLLDVAETPDQLATVISHEIAHVIADHGNERVSQQFAVAQGLELINALAGETSATQRTLMGLLGVGAQVGVLLPYSRLQESEADKLGLDYMARAGFDPRASIELWRNMAQAGGEQPPQFLSTHPSHGARIEDLQARLDRAMKLYRQARTAGRYPQCHR